MNIDDLGYVRTSHKAQKPNQISNKKDEGETNSPISTTKVKVNHMSNVENTPNAETPKTAPAAGGKETPVKTEASATESKMSKVKGAAATTLEAGRDHALKPLAYGFFGAAGAILAYKGAKKVNLL